MEKHYNMKRIKLYLVDEVLLPDDGVVLELYADTMECKDNKANYYATSVSLVSGEVDLLLENATLDEAKKEFKDYVKDFIKE